MRVVKFFQEHDPISGALDWWFTVDGGDKFGPFLHRLTAEAESRKVVGIPVSLDEVTEVLNQVKRDAVNHDYRITPATLLKVQGAISDLEGTKERNRTGVVSDDG